MKYAFAILLIATAAILVDLSFRGGRATEVVVTSTENYGYRLRADMGRLFAAYLPMPN